MAHQPHAGMSAELDKDASQLYADTSFVRDCLPPDDPDGDTDSARFLLLFVLCRLGGQPVETVLAGLTRAEATLRELTLLYTREMQRVQSEETVLRRLLQERQSGRQQASAADVPSAAAPSAEEMLVLQASPQFHAVASTPLSDLLADTQQHATRREQQQHRPNTVDAADAVSRDVASPMESQ